MWQNVENWCIWVRGILEVFVLYLQLFFKFEFFLNNFFPNSKPQKSSSPIHLSGALTSLPVHFQRGSAEQKVFVGVLPLKVKERRERTELHIPIFLPTYHVTRSILKREEKIGSKARRVREIPLRVNLVDEKKASFPTLCPSTRNR